MLHWNQLKEDDYNKLTILNTLPDNEGHHQTRIITHHAQLWNLSFLQQTRTPEAKILLIYQD